MSAHEIVKKSVHLYSDRFGVSFAQFLLVLSYTGIGLMLICTVKTVAFPQVNPGVTSGFLEFLAVSAVIFLAMYAISTPYIYGGVWYSENAAEVNIVPAAALFGCYNEFDRVAKALKLESLIFIRRFPVLLPIAVVSGVNIYLTVNIIRFTSGLMPLFAAVGCLFSVFGLFILYKVYALRFFPARHIFAENPDLPAKEIISRSLALTKGKSNLLASMYLRLLPLYLLSLLILPALFVMPIAIGCYTYLYKSISQALPS
ncbi:MAG: hypothetical protein LBL80_00095 [Ruminococcus sp.]|jgi:uncharacterized membrane protein|nr:hypothetical protein [Ruminococcus sp.]